ncbi:hypothetical protein L8W64_08755 [Campylobacter sp. IFREMER_LSEM_CL1097]|uniref:hypothetical protein n=1 Tax=Campylobacter sp. IFREMER_LSEM_CL1097 TaxID=2911613 RepID=UPI0021E69A52|nr:hypothetical protein [Campylobacter sp. IFREMER_LSEM_CL1097]MCV3444027.1 hypothetical protein [Campylobacter sp. IFREMER_LSEM_CL1097]
MFSFSLFGKKKENLEITAEKKGSKITLLKADKDSKIIADNATIIINNSRKDLENLEIGESKDNSEISISNAKININNTDTNKKKFKKFKKFIGIICKFIGIIKTSS